MDRNACDSDGSPVAQVGVATREGGVDRNANSTENGLQGCFVATREGGVDRNIIVVNLAC